MKSKVENHQNNKIRVKRTDNGCSHLDNYLSQGIIDQKTNPYTPEQNGLAARSSRTIVEEVRCILFEAEANTAKKRFHTDLIRNETGFDFW